MFANIQYICLYAGLPIILFILGIIIMGMVYDFGWQMGYEAGLNG